MENLSKKVMGIVLILGTVFGVFITDVTYQAFLAMLLSVFLLVSNVDKQDGVGKRFITLAVGIIIAIVLCSVMMFASHLVSSTTFVKDEFLFGILICISFGLIINVAFLILLEFSKKSICMGIIGVAFLYLAIISNFMGSVMKVIDQTVSSDIQTTYVLPWDLLMIALVIFAVGSGIAILVHNRRRKCVTFVDELK